MPVPNAVLVGAREKIGHRAREVGQRVDLVKPQILHHLTNTPHTEARPWTEHSAHTEAAILDVGGLGWVLGLENRAEDVFDTQQRERTDA